MELILLPGLDGTGLLFGPLIKCLPKDLKARPVSYPLSPLTYLQLAEYVKEHLPKDEDFVIIAESFSGPIACLLAQNPPSNLKKVIFVATFLSTPRPSLIKTINYLPVGHLTRLLPDFAVKALLLGSGANDELISLFRKTLKSVPPNVIHSRLKEISKLKLNCDKIPIDCSYIQATGDRLVANARLEDFNVVSNRIRVHQVAGPHFILQANPKECANIMIEEIELL